MVEHRTERVEYALGRTVDLDDGQYVCEVDPDDGTFRTDTGTPYAPTRKAIGVYVENGTIVAARQMDTSDPERHMEYEWVEDER